MKWTHEHFTGKRWRYSEPSGNNNRPSPTGLDWDQRSKTKGVFRIVSDKHKGWSLFVDKEFGNYDYLLGIDVRPSRCIPVQPTMLNIIPD